jgi:hypothetical protein
MGADKSLIRDGCANSNQGVRVPRQHSGEGDVCGRESIRTRLTQWRLGESIGIEKYVCATVKLFDLLVCLWMCINFEWPLPVWSP